MQFLVAGTQSYTVVLAGAKNTNDCPVTVHYETIPVGTQQGVNPFPNDSVTPTSTNGVTPVTIMSGPTGQYKYRVQGITLFNADLAAITATIKFVDSTGSVSNTEVQFTLQTLEQAVYDAGNGWQCFDVNGALKSQAAATSSGTSTADSKAVSVATALSTETSTVTAQSTTTSSAVSSATVAASTADSKGASAGSVATTASSTLSLNASAGTSTTLSKTKSSFGF